MVSAKHTFNIRGRSFIKMFQLQRGDLRERELYHGIEKSSQLLGQYVFHLCPLCFLGTTGRIILMITYVVEQEEGEAIP